MVPTQNERKALWFLAIVALSGTAVRVLRPNTIPPTSAEADALELQLKRVDSVRSERKRDARTPKKKSKGGSGDGSRTLDSMPRPAPPSPAALIDLDRATASEMEALPGIGPSLAKRIVANRDSGGSFGSVDALCGVRGVGPKLAERLRPLVTFTGPRRPLSDACGAPRGTSRKRRGS